MYYFRIPLSNDTALVIVIIYMNKRHNIYYTKLYTFKELSPLLKKVQVK